VAGPSAEKRHRAESKHQAMPGGRFPIENRADLLKAIKAVGRAKGGEAGRGGGRRDQAQRAKALGLTSLLPDSWNSDGSLKN
jgi:hypothetical protein